MKRINPAQASWLQPQFQDVKLCMRRRRRQSERATELRLHLSSSDKVIEISEAAAAAVAETNDTSTKVCRQFTGESGEQIESSGPGAIKCHSGSPTGSWAEQSRYILNPKQHKLTRLIGQRILISSD